MNARHKRRTRRVPAAVTTEHDTLMRIHQQLNRLQAPVDPDVLRGINGKLERIESSLGDIRADAVRLGTNAGAIAGGITGGLSGGLVTLAILFIKARLEL